MPSGHNILTIDNLHVLQNSEGGSRSGQFITIKRYFMTSHSDSTIIIDNREIRTVEKCINAFHVTHVDRIQ